MINWIITNAGTLTNVANGLWISMSLMVSVYMAGLLRKTQDTIVRNFVLGILLVAISSALHRLWWFMGILLAEPGQKYATWATDYRAILLSLVFVIAIGYTLHVRAALRGKYGKWWWALPTIIAGVGVSAGLLL